MEALGNIESDAVERLTGKNAVGDVAFGLANTMIAFAHANLVILIRNAGRTVVGIGSVARRLDNLLTRWGKSSRSR